MAVLTTDILLRGIKRDQVFDWLGDPENHRRILEGAFEGMKVVGPGQFELTFTAPVKKRTLGYRFSGLDDSHAGRRANVVTTGKRMEGELHYSLRTMKPSSNTLVTLHMDVPTGGIDAVIFDNFVRKPLEASFVKILDNLSRIIPRTSVPADE
jgi:hypothetical protein